MPQQTLKDVEPEEDDTLCNRQAPIRIGFSMDTLLEERWLRDRDLFKEAVEALGAEVEIVAANGDDALTDFTGRDAHSKRHRSIGNRPT